MDSRLKKLLISLLVAFVAFVAFLFMPTISWRINPDMGEFAGRLIDEIEEFAIFFIAALILKRANVLKFKTKGLGIGLLILIIPLLQKIGFIPELVESYRTYGTCMTIPVSEFICLLFFVIVVGMAEELFARGLIQNALHDFFGEKTRAGVRAAIILQAVIFGVLHYINVIASHADFFSVTLQVLMGIGMGAVFGVIYYRSGKNLWVSIVAHALNDLLGLINSGALMGSTVDENIQGLGSVADEFNVSPMFVIAVLAVYNLIFILYCFPFTGKKAIAKMQKEAV